MRKIKRILVLAISNIIINTLLQTNEQYMIRMAEMFFKHEKILENMNLD